MMNLVIEIDKAIYEERTITTNDSEFIVREQLGWLQLPGERYPQKITLQLNNNQSAHQVGTYHVSPNSVTINRFGALAFKRVLELETIEKEAAA